MMKHLVTKAILLLSLSLTVSVLSGQFTTNGQVITLDATIPVNSPCTNIVINTKIEFERAGGCGGNIGVNREGIEVLNIAVTQDTFSYTFSEEGLFRVFCGTPPPNSSGIFKACFNVSPAQTVPTMGEWGLISLSLLLLITMVVAFRTGLSKTTVGIQ